MQLGADSIKKLLGLVLVGVAVGVAVMQMPARESHKQISDKYESQNINPQYRLRILFIGNSYTFFHDMPKLLTDIASADPQANTQLSVQSDTRGGVGLQELWNDGKAMQLIREKRWDMVVLQDQSFWALSEGSVRITQAMVKQFDRMIREAGAGTVLFLTWARKPGSQWYTDPQYPFLKGKDANQMQNAFTQQTRGIASSIGARMVPVGEYWRAALNSDPSLPLYEEDGSHPSLAGAYFTALVFYRTLTGRDVTQIPTHPKGIDDALAAKLKALAARPLPR